MIVVLWRDSHAIHEVTSPHIYSLVALEGCDVEHDHAAVSPAIKRIAQTLKAFLTSSVPDLERHHFSVINLYFFLNEICPNSCFLREAWFLVLETFYNTWLSDAWVTDYYDFQKLLALRPRVGSRVTYRPVCSSIAVRKVRATLYMLLRDEICAVLDPIFLSFVFLALVRSCSLTIISKLNVWDTCQPTTVLLLVEVSIGVAGYVSFSSISTGCLILH